MKKIKRNFFLIVAVFGFLIFLLCVQSIGQVGVSQPSPAAGRVVISAPILLLLFGGDRFLASDIEAIRLAATSVERGQADVSYLLRAQVVVAELNACHEDNYYLANGLLAWGGADHEAAEVLSGAMNCRFWDSAPAFFYGFNRSFFQRDAVEAARALELAAIRSPEHATAYRKLSIMLRVESFADERLALSYLIQQRDNAKSDPKLRKVLDQRVIRLQGLVALRDAQRQFESRYGPLKSLQQLVDKGLLSDIPVDPLGLGYELQDGRVALRKLSIGG